MQIQRKSNGSAALRIAGRLIFSSPCLLAAGGVAALVVLLLFCHAFSLDFGRRHPYNPFWGGFVIESLRTGTFKRFSETKVMVLSVSITEEQHAFHIVWKQESCYYCSEFVGELLTKSRVDGTEQLRSSIIQPMQFLRMPHTLLYCGKLREYVCDPCSEDICEDIMNRTVHRRLP